MPLIIEKPVKSFDLSQIHVGDLICAKYRIWEKGVSGFVSAVSSERILVQYHPNIGNIVNHFGIPIEEAVKGDWEIRWSEDLSTVHEFSTTDGETITEEPDEQEDEKPEEEIDES